jgi:PIF1-like helicase/Helix-turn-helix domain/HRDC domain/Helicase
MDTEYMQKTDTSNTLFTLASDLVNNTSRNIFLTGRAGTGKTTFLRYIKENCPKQMVVVAPTGVAAINAGGVTIHSFFQLPLGPFVPEAKGVRNNDEVTNKHTLLSRLRLNRERRKVIQEMELLIIDEISMVRCDVLDAIDLVLRHVRYRHSERFGGAQVLFIGDLFQLPPVVKEQEWNILKDDYNSPYFFDSHVVKEDPPVYVEFTRIYRQTEEKFIHLLNKVRNNEMDEEDINALNDRYEPDFFGYSSEGYIVLTTHNEKARQINTQELEKLPGEIFTYQAEVKEEFPPTAFPAEERLQLKPGAQVMFVRNDTDKSKRYFNGKIGVIIELSEDKILVQCKDEDFPIEVSKEKWQNIRYTLDTSTRQLNEDVLGSFSQYPLRLAWAITIHKSQGLSFEKAVIDAGKAFAPGQVYVALSRCTNLEGMVLHSRIKPNTLFTDDRIVQFTRNILPFEDLQQELFLAKKTYQQKILSSLFDFRKVINGMKELGKYLLEYTTSFNTEVFSWREELENRLLLLQTTAEKFQNQLIKLFGATEKVDDNVELQERMKTAANWFSNGIRSVIENILQSPAITDSAIRAKEYNELLREIYVQLALQNFLFQGFNGKFSMEAFHRRKKSFIAPSFGVNAYAGTTEKTVELSHPALYYQLKKLRDNICLKKNLPIYFVANSKTLEEMTTYLPQTLGELEQISGFGKSKVETYGAEFLSLINEYCLENKLSSNIASKSPKRKRKESNETKADTKAESFRLYKEGQMVNEISKERNLAVQTIEGHLAYYVQQGLIKIEELVSREKIVLIEPEVRDFKGGAIGPIKEKLGSHASWGEIRLVLAWMEYQRSSAHVNH